MSFRRDFIAKPIFSWAQRVLPATAAHEAVAKVIEVDDFAPEALSPIYKKPADVHPFFQEIGEQRAAS
jgi:acyl-CoA dehydrogenase